MRAAHLIGIVVICCSLAACGRSGAPTAPARSTAPADEKPVAAVNSEKPDEEEAGERFFLDWLL